MTKRIGLLIVLLALASEAVADQIVLKNGDRLTGTIVKSDGKTIVFKSDLVGEVVVALDNVENITADKPLYLTLTDGRIVAGLVTAKNNQFEVQSSHGPVVVERAASAVVRSADETTIERHSKRSWARRSITGSHHVYI